MRLKEQAGVQVPATTGRPILEQRAYHGYTTKGKPIPKRTGRQAQERTDVPPASPHRVGHHPGLQPEDMPYTTTTRTRNASAYDPDTLTQTRTKNPYKVPPPDEYEYDERDDGYENPGYTRQSIIVRRQPPPTRVEPVTHTEPLEPKRQLHPLVYVGVSMLVMLVFIVGYIYIPPAWQRHLDDTQYGYPRTFQVDANVGHAGVSHFIVTNLHGTIEVVEIPSDPRKNQPHLYIIVRFANNGADLLPATVTFTDFNGDGKPDMEVTVYNGPNPTMYVLFNDGTTFKSHL